MKRYIKIVLKNSVKSLLNFFGVYESVSKAFIKLYYPYKYHRIEKNVSNILSRIKPIFDNNTADWWLDYGTLLGCVREGKIIKNDIDLDFAIILQNGTLQNEMEKGGFLLLSRTIVDDAITLEQYSINNIVFDVFYYRKESDKLVTNIWLASDHSVSKSVAYEKGLGNLSETTFSYSETKEKEFYNVKCRIPKNYKIYLSEHFGEDYATPNPNWTQDDEKNRVEVQKEFQIEIF